jgi:hypothetical protein
VNRESVEVRWREPFVRTAQHVTADTLRFTLDGDPIAFSLDPHGSAGDRMGSIVINVHESLIIDDNLPEPRDVRVLYTDGDPMTWDAGFWDAIVPTGAGTLHLAFSDRYERWYKLRVEVKERGQVDVDRPIGGSG